MFTKLTKHRKDGKKNEKDFRSSRVATDNTTNRQSRSIDSIELDSRSDLSQIRPDEQSQHLLQHENRMTSSYSAELACMTGNDISKSSPQRVTVIKSDRKQRRVWFGDMVEQNAKDSSSHSKLHRTYSNSDNESRRISSTDESCSSASDSSSISSLSDHELNYEHKVHHRSNRTRHGKRYQRSNEVKNDRGRLSSSSSSSSIDSDNEFDLLGWDPQTLSALMQQRRKLTKGSSQLPSWRNIGGRSNAKTTRSSQVPPNRCYTPQQLPSNRSITGPELVQQPANTKFEHPNSCLLSRRCQNLSVPSTASSTNRFNSPFQQQQSELLAIIMQDYRPSWEWREQYRALNVCRGDYVCILDDQSSNQYRRHSSSIDPNSEWIYVRKWCLDHLVATGSPGFVPRNYCRIIQGCDQLRRTTTTKPTVKSSSNSSTVSSSDGQKRPLLSSIQLHQPPPPPPPPGFGSGASLVGSEIEDRDSGRGPSSGSDWGSGRGESLNVSLERPMSCGDKTILSSDLGFDSLCVSTSPEHNQSEASWSIPEWLRDGKSVTSDGSQQPQTDHLAVTLTTRDNEAQPVLEMRPCEEGAPPTLHASDYSSTQTLDKPVETESTLDLTQWEPYKTVIHINESSLEKFTLV